MEVLVVEDDATLRRALCKELEISGIDVESASDGKEGLKLALEHKPKLILLDLLMPEMDGHKVLEHLRKDTWGKDADVIVLSNTDDYDSVYKTMEKSVNDYFVKADTSIKKLASIVKQRIGK